MNIYNDVIGDVERKKERKKERHLRQWKNENESCLRWDSNPRHSVLRTDALPTVLVSLIQVHCICSCMRPVLLKLVL